MAFLLSLVDGDGHHAGVHHPERPRGADGDIDDPAAYEGPAIVDNALDGASAMANRDNAAHRFCPVGAGHAMAAAAVIGGEAGLGVSGGKSEEGEGNDQGGLLHASFSVAAPRGNELRIRATR